MSRVVHDHSLSGSYKAGVGTGCGCLTAFGLATVVLVTCLFAGCGLWLESRTQERLDRTTRPVTPANPGGLPPAR